MARVALCEVRGLLVDTIEKLSGEDGTEWAEAFKQILRKGIFSLLRRVADVAVGAVSRFVVADAFGPGNPDGIRFFSGNDFNAFFPSKVEEGVEPGTIKVHRLEKDSYDHQIVAELGVEVVVIKFGHLYELLKAQGQGQQDGGPLLINGDANVAYIEDGETVRAVSAAWNWEYRGWFVNVRPFGFPAKWLAGCRVLSR